MNYNSVRFQELRRYDPLLDERVVCFMAITDAGSFHAEVPCSDGAERREYRKVFRERTTLMMDEGKDPCEVDLG